MSAADIPADLLKEAERVAQGRAVLDLVNRELGAVLKIDGILRRAIEQEEALGVDICAPEFIQILWLLNAAVASIVGELGRA